MIRIRLREILFAVLLLGAIAVIPATGGTQAMEMTCGSGPNAFGQHVSEMARMQGGMAAATAYHNANNDDEPDLTIGEHTRMMHDMCGK